jgi:hypothetical protein
MLRSQPVAQDLGHEPLGRPPREVLGERQHEELVDARGVDQRGLALDRGE